MSRPLYELGSRLQQFVIADQLGLRRGGQVTGPIEGTYGSIYSIEVHRFLRIAAKCPRMRRFGTRAEARSGCEKILHELETTHQVFMIPWVNRFFDVQLIFGWPFILSRFCDGTLQDLISNPLAWAYSDRLVSLILIARALRLASDRGIATHQDLKPENVFFDDLSRKSIPKDSQGMHFHIFVGDFGLANAFRDFGRNQGSRPYMAPEQFEHDAADPSISPAFDVFALAVIACECLLDGRHPSGVITRDCWPWKKGMPQKWNQESIWRKWSESTDKALPESDRFPRGIPDLLLDSLAADPKKRPSLRAFEDSLWEVLRTTDQRTEDGARMQVEYIEGLSPSLKKPSQDLDWPHMDDRITQLRKFYSSI
jgi:serine/threonine protein kinase